MKFSCGACKVGFVAKVDAEEDRETERKRRDKEKAEVIDPHVVVILFGHGHLV